MSNRQEYVVFLSPGTMFDEVSSKPIVERDLKCALNMSGEVVERYGAKPYGFYFETLLEAGTVRDDEGNEFETAAKTVDKTGIYYIAGKVRTRDDIARDGKEDERILLSNMGNDGWEIVCETVNGYKHVGIFRSEDAVVDIEGNVLDRGNDQKYVEYRANSRRMAVGVSTG